MTASAWDKFVLLSWKNWIIQIRHPIQTVFEVLVPILICALLILIRGLVEVTEYDELRYPSFPPTNMSAEILANPEVNKFLSYSPSNPLLDEMMRNVVTEINFERVVGQANAQALESFALSDFPFASIEFEDSLKDVTELPTVINYAIRFPAEMRTTQADQLRLVGFFYNWATNSRLTDEFSIGPRNQDDDDGGTPPGYIPQGFIAIQNAVERQIISRSTNLNLDDLPPLSIQRFPYPAYVRDVVGTILEFAFPILFLIAFLYNTINIIKYITVEKEMQLKETMKIMGLPSYMHWIAWFTKCMLFFIIIISVVTGLFKIQFSSRSGLAIFTYGNWLIIWLFLFVYSLAAVTYSFMFSTFFNRANIASIVGAVTWFIIQVPYTLINANYNNVSLGVKLGASIFCNTGMGLGFKVLAQYENAKVGIQWDNLFNPISPDDDLTLGAIMVVMLVASALQMLIALYVEKIKPGEFGVPEKFYFPFTIKFWTGKVSTKGFNNDYPEKQNEDFEDEPIGKNAGIKIRGLRKVYGKKVAVDNLNLNMYEDQITVLLGHNGAGKSTTMSMLTGLYQPTSGTAFIDDKDIRVDLQAIRSSLGLCPQHNVLFNELTVKEHITFFSKLKGLKSKSEIDEQIRKYVEMLELTPKLNAQSKTLSGGMKRKLSVGIALCGNSRIVMCDEPTSGMDPAARRALWDVLIQEKKGRTILLTTHFMDEADVLGDRIAIMADGDLKTVGSSFFLKKKFGAGYRLVCVKGQGCDPSRLTELLAKYIPGIQVETNIGSELTYILNELYIGQFKTIFAELEANTEKLKIGGFGVSLTTLEEVFLKVGTDTELAAASDSPDTPKEDYVSNETLALENGNVQNSTEVLQVEYSKFLHGAPLLFSQIIAMTIKKFLYSIRNYILLIIQFLIPVVFVSLTMLTDSFFDGDRDLPPLPINFKEYLLTVTTLEQGEMTENSLANQIFKSYQTMFSILPDRAPFNAHTLQNTQTNFEDAILQQYAVSVSRTNLNFMVGASFKDNAITAWFNNQGFHTAPLSINVINNAILRQASGDNTRSMNLVNKPLPFALSSRLSQLGAGNNLGFQIAFNLGFALAFVTAMFVMFYIKERVSRAKLLQFVSGVNKVVFWLTSFVIDYLVFILITALLVGVLAAYQKDGYSNWSELSRVIQLLVLFGFAALPFTYLWSLLFQVPSTGLVRLAILYIITGVFFFMAFFLLDSELWDLQYIAKPLSYVFLLFPHYSMARGLSNLNVLQSTLNICTQRVCDFTDVLGLPCNDDTLDNVCESAAELNCDAPRTTAEQGLCSLKTACCDIDFYGFSGNGIGINLVALSVIGVVTFILLLCFEYRLIQNIFFKLKKQQRPTDIPESEDGFIDSDVYAEKEKIRSVTSYLQATNNLVVKDLTKFYGKQLAVNQICVGVDKNECFGLLGVNGAGKTSTFKMLTGDESISWGEAWVDGISVKTNMNKVHKRIGYCPQFDAMIDDLTGRETLRIFALLRGVKRDEIERVSLQLAEELSFTKHLDKRVKAYSGGNKRKLSTALALIGDPSVIYLDEPTSGMDVGARRQLWNMVIKARNAGKSVVLTSHSMEECEVLCTRLAIMVNGEFKCLGSTQHLKNKFSKGFYLTIKVGYETEELSHKDGLNQRILNVKTFVTTTFPTAVLKEEYMDIMTYHIPVTNVKWSHMFGLMEEAKVRLNIDDYSLGQTSLEQVFLFFTKYQRETK